MKILGKTSHELDQIKERFDEGFREFELYTKKEFLNPSSIEELKKIKKAYKINFISMHTPHVTLQELVKFSSTIDLVVKEIGIKYVVMHSSKANSFSKKFLGLVHGNRIIENTKDHSVKDIFHLFEAGYGICLDISHLFESCYKKRLDFFQSLEEILKRGKKKIKIVHFCNTDFKNGNSGLIEGVIDVERAFRILEKHYNGYVVVEVPMELMKRDRDYLFSLMKKPAKKTN